MRRKELDEKFKNEFITINDIKLREEEIEPKNNEAAVERLREIDRIIKKLQKE